MEEERKTCFADVLAERDIKLAQKKKDLLECYCTELWKRNEHINLTRHTDYETFVCRDLVDTLHLADQLQKKEHVLDVGTGGGVPGIPLQILRPDVNVELCDSTGKKTTALAEILEAMGLEMNVWYAKAEELLKVHRFHTLVLRGVAKMDKLLTMFAPYWHTFDRILLIKGPHWVEERGYCRHMGLMNNIALRKVDEYINPGAELPSVILQLCLKSRLEELEKRDEARRAGEPIARSTEAVGVEKEKRPFRDEKKTDRMNRETDKKASDKKTSDKKRSKRSSRFSKGGFEKHGKGWVHKEGRFVPKGPEPDANK